MGTSRGSSTVKSVKMSVTVLTYRLFYQLQLKKHQSLHFSTHNSISVMSHNSISVMSHNSNTNDEMSMNQQRIYIPLQ